MPERMMTMLDLSNTTALVMSILEQDKQCRNSDSFLYLSLLKILGKQKGVDIDSMSITTFLLTMREHGFPPFESVRRARQKIQAQYPELAACSRVQGFRGENEKVFRDYAVGDV